MLEFAVWRDIIMRIYNKKKAQQWLIKYPQYSDKIAPWLFSNKSFMIDLADKVGSSIIFSSPKLQGDVEYVHHCVKSGCWMLSDQELFSRATLSDGFPYTITCKDGQHVLTYSLVSSIYKLFGNCYSKNISTNKPFEHTRSGVNYYYLTSIDGKQCISPLAYAKPEARSNLSIAIDAVSNDPFSLQYVMPQISTNLELLVAAAKRHPISATLINKDTPIETVYQLIQAVPDTIFYLDKKFLNEKSYEIAINADKNLLNVNIQGLGISADMLDRVFEGVVKAQPQCLTKANKNVQSNKRLQQIASQVLDQPTQSNLKTENNTSNADINPNMT